MTSKINLLTEQLNKICYDSTNLSVSKSGNKNLKKDQEINTIDNKYISMNQIYNDANLNEFNDLNNKP